MKLIKIYSLSIISILIFTGCASGYKIIQPKELNYLSKNQHSNVFIEYKYDLLSKKYAKKEDKKGIKLVALKITNNSEKDLTFGSDLKLIYESGKSVSVLDTDYTFNQLKQSTPSYLFYLLLTPMSFFTTETNEFGVQETTSSFPIGLIVGPGLAGGNMIAAGSANKKLKNELLEYNLSNRVIKKGETVYGLIGIQSNSADAIALNVEK